jgi:hypothetical protein
LRRSLVKFKTLQSRIYEPGGTHAVVGIYAESYIIARVQREG